MLKLIFLIQIQDTATITDNATVYVIRMLLILLQTMLLLQIMLLFLLQIMQLSLLQIM